MTTEEKSSELNETILRLEDELSERDDSITELSNKIAQLLDLLRDVGYCANEIIAHAETISYAWEDAKKI